MKSQNLKIPLLLLLGYVLLVVLFESSLGYFQPENASTLQITTVDGAGNASTRVVARLESDGRLYVAANHWPRAWYREALANPALRVDSDRERGAYTAVPVGAEEHDAVNADNPLGLVFRILTGFPPRYFLRLEPQD